MTVFESFGRRFTSFRTKDKNGRKQLKASLRESDSTKHTTPIAKPHPLLPRSLPLVLPKHNYNLADQGWTTVTFTDPHNDLLVALNDLFRASSAFFTQPDEYKRTFAAKNAGDQGSEEGYNSIPGEKEFITLRRMSTTPPELRKAAEQVWSEAAKLLHEMLGSIAETLALPPDTYTRFSKPCLQIQETLLKGTMLRLFRYENTEPKTVAEPHCDLGLLSLVIGDTPGLEVWSKYRNAFIPIEQTYTNDQPRAASVLVGRQLQRFTNNRYVPGGHRVVAYDDATLQQFAEMRMDSRYRFSIVFVLRADWDVLVDTDTMTSQVTGEHAEPIRGVAARDFFKGIQAKHFNVNIGLEERARQKAKMAEAQENLQSGRLPVVAGSG